MLPLPVVNLAEAKYECIFGRGCDGICCQEGRPHVEPDEVVRLDEHLDHIRPHLRPEAQAVLKKSGYLDRRSRTERPIVRVVKKWCIFFNQGCVLHRLGAEEGDKFKYKPQVCAWFPLAKDYNGEWYIRQEGYRDEAWELFCLNPNLSPVPAAESLREELEFARPLMTPPTAAERKERAE